MTKEAQKPAGQWQDSKCRAQTPGSYLGPSLRIPSELPGRDDGHLSATRWVRSFIVGRCVVVARDDPTFQETAATLGCGQIGPTCP